MPIRFAAGAAAAALAAMPFLAAPLAAAELALTCAAFGPATTHADLEKAFGKANVTFKEVPGPEGSTAMATVVFDGDEAKRLEVYWDDEARKARPLTLQTTGSAWVGEAGLRIGTTLAEVEKLNGKPFELSGFDWDYGGTVTDWKGGAFGKRGGDCHVGVRFEPGPGGNSDKVSGDAAFMSSNKAMKAAKPRIYDLSIGYPSLSPD